MATRTDSGSPASIRGKSLRRSLATRFFVDRKNTEKWSCFLIKSLNIFSKNVVWFSLEKENIYIYFIHLSHNFLPIEMICLSSNANSYTSVHSVSRQDGAWMPESGKSKLAPKIFQPEEVCFVLPISALQKTSRHESFWTDKNEPKNSETSSVKSFLPIQFLNHLGGIEGLSSKCLVLKDVLSLGFLLE